jgi:hypothetical protein
MQEMERVLTPVGSPAFTVPWRDDSYVEEFKHRGDLDAYWAPGDGDKAFFHGAYDRDTLERRLAGPVASRVSISASGESGRCPWSLARLFLRPLAERELSRKKVACLTLRKAKA